MLGFLFICFPEKPTFELQDYVSVEGYYVPYVVYMVTAFKLQAVTLEFAVMLRSYQNYPKCSYSRRYEKLTPITEITALVFLNQFWRCEENISLVSKVPSALPSSKWFFSNLLKKKCRILLLCCSVGWWEEVSLKMRHDYLKEYRRKQNSPGEELSNIL